MATVHKMRREHGLPTVDMSLHMVFTGNPGTGKTMIARLMARIYRSLGILLQGAAGGDGPFRTGGGLCGADGPEDRPRLSKKAERAGAPFIDEAYALNGSGQNDFGQEAIDTLLKAMEDNREDLVVIVAGYDQLMENFIRSNPGLESRFKSVSAFRRMRIPWVENVPDSGTAAGKAPSRPWTRRAKGPPGITSRLATPMPSPSATPGACGIFSNGRRRRRPTVWPGSRG